MSQSDHPKNTGLGQFAEWIILITGVGVLAITLMVSFDVLMRYFFDEPQLFIDELTSFILVGVIFLGTGPVFYKGGHIRGRRERSCRNCLTVSPTIHRNFLLPEESKRGIQEFLTSLYRASSASEYP
ncbi:MAG: TRAP transporter small permease [Deltaproteobacteria bacterium]|nr:TRAP transporter small permease [Deltaproteobacteria bacterium]